MTTSTVYVKKLSDSAKFYPPAHKGDIGFDLYADEDMILQSSFTAPATDNKIKLDDMKPIHRKLVGTGISISFESGYARIASRSGLSLKGIDVVAGVVDSSYRGELKVCLVNNSTHRYVQIMRGDKIAQLIFEQASVPEIVYSQDLENSTRGADGFGSTDLPSQKRLEPSPVDIETTNV